MIGYKKKFNIAEKIELSDMIADKISRSLPYAELRASSIEHKTLIKSVLLQFLEQEIPNPSEYLDNNDQ